MNDFFIKIKNLEYVFFITMSFIINIIIIKVKLKDTYKKDEIFKFIIFECIGIIFGAKVLDILVNIEEYIYVLLNLRNKSIIFTRGYMFFGSIFGSMLAIYVYSSRYNKSFKQLIEVLVPNLVLIYAISKIGCYLNGCCEGKMLVNGVRIPIQLIESVISFLIYILIILKKENKICIASLTFCISRYCLEFFRDNNSIMPISISQVLSILIIIMIVLVNYKKNLYFSTNYNKIENTKQRKKHK